jgi:hypothetical protein
MELNTFVDMDASQFLKDSGEGAILIYGQQKKKAKATAAHVQYE